MFWRVDKANSMGLFAKKSAARLDGLQDAAPALRAEIDVETVIVGDQPNEGFRYMRGQVVDDEHPARAGVGGNGASNVEREVGLIPCRT